MASVTTNRSWLVPVFALSLATFAVCTAELMIAGLLPAVARDLDVDIPTAGLLITGYALGVAIAGPILALLTTAVSRRSLLIAVMAVFVAGNILCALSSSYGMLLGSRLLIACCHGLFFGVAMVIASRLAPEGRQGSAISLVLAGATLANVLGIPIGTAIGNAYGWHTTFWVIAGAGVLAMAGLVLLIPSAVEPSRGDQDLRAELRAAVQPAVLLCYGIIVLFMLAVFSLFTYLVPLLTTVSGVPLAYIPLVLFGMGFVGFFGNLAGGRLGDWHSNATMIGILALFTVITFGMAAVVTRTWGMVAALLAAWLIGFGFPAPVQSRILKEAAAAPSFASTLISTAFNVGIASGAAIGGAAIAAGWGYAALPLIDASVLSLALVGTLVLTGYDRRRRPPAVASPAG